jgi:hypothetical protein
MATKQESAAEQQAKLNATKVVSDTCRLSYLHVFKPAAMTNEQGQAVGEPKYSVSVIIPKSNTAMVDKIKAAIDTAIQQGITGKWGGKKPANLKLPLRDGDTDRPDNPEYKDSYFVTASSKTKPNVVGRSKEELIESDVYSGMYGRVSMNFYPFNTAGSKGVACGLNHIQKVKDGEPLGGRGSADEDFDVVEDDDLMGD